MKSLITLIVLAGIVHVIAHVPVGPAFIGAGILWLIWRLKWLILGIIGIDMLMSE